MTSQTYRKETNRFLNNNRGCIIFNGFTITPIEFQTKWYEISLLIWVEGHEWSTKQPWRHETRKKTDVKKCNGQGKSRIVDYLDYHDLTTLGFCLSWGWHARPVAYVRWTCIVNITQCFTKHDEQSVNIEHLWTFIVNITWCFTKHDEQSVCTLNMYRKHYAMFHETWWTKRKHWTFMNIYRKHYVMFHETWWTKRKHFYISRHSGLQTPDWTIWQKFVFVHRILFPSINRTLRLVIILFSL